MLRLDFWQRFREKEGLPRITHVCNTAANAVPVPPEQNLDGVTFLNLEMLDAPFPMLSPGSELWQHTLRDIRAAVDFVSEAYDSGGAVLVNCYAGQNRSGAVLLAWMLTHESMGFTPFYAKDHLRRVEPECLNNVWLERCALEVAGITDHDTVDADLALDRARSAAWQISMAPAQAQAPVEVIEEDEPNADCLEPLF